MERMEGWVEGEDGKESGGLVEGLRVKLCYEIRRKPEMTADRYRMLTLIGLHSFYR